MRRSLLLAALLLNLCASAADNALNIFVAPPDKGGNDAHDGSREKPFATVAKAHAVARAFRAEKKPNQPIVITLRGGRYELAEPIHFTLDDSGTPESPLLIVAADGEKPILSGGRKVGPFVLKDGVGTATLPEAQNGAWRFETIAVNGELRHVPKLPKTGHYVIAGLAGADPKAKYDTPANKLEFTAGEISPQWKNLNDVEAVVLHFWVDTHLKIASIDEEKRIVTFDRSSRRKFTDDHNVNKFARYYLRNIREALAPGEFYLDAKTGELAIAFKPGENTESADVIVPKLPELVRFTGKPQEKKFVAHIEFRGIQFADTAWSLSAKDAGDLQAASSVPGAITLTGAQHIALRNCTLKNLATYGIDIREGSQNNTIERCEISYLGGGAIRLNGHGPTAPDNLKTGRTTITDNHIHHCGEVYHSAVGVLSMNSFENTISHNHIHHLYYTGISVGWIWGYHPSVSQGNKIENNYIHHIGQKMLSDMGAIYTLGPQPGTVIRGNHIHDVDSWSYGGWGIYTDEGSSNILIENNLVYRTKTGGFHQHYGKENTVRNNIFALMTQDMLQNSRAEKHLGFTFEKNIVYSAGAKLLGNNWRGENFKNDNNLYFDTSNPAPKFFGMSFEDWKKKGHDSHSVLADPLFEDPAKDDYRLKKDSPALKLGIQPVDVSKAGPRK